MKKRIGAVVLAGALLGAAALFPAISEGRGGRGGGSGRCGQAQCQQTGANGTQGRQRLRDGSCGNANCPQGTPGANCPSAAVRQGTRPQGGAGAPPATK